MPKLDEIEQSGVYILERIFPSLLGRRPLSAGKELLIAVVYAYHIVVVSIWQIWKTSFSNDGQRPTTAKTAM